ncbi:MAG TPA: GNAT family N-acetyltransferase [Herpetosiphonaceae bacterium]
MPELSQATLAAVDRYWAAFFGCDPAIFAAPQTAVVPHASLGDYHGVFLFRRREALIISVPPDRLERDRAALGAFPATLLDDLPTLQAQIAAPIERVVGPAFVGYADAGTFRAASEVSTRLLTDGDHDRFERFRQACSALEWEHGGSELGEQPVVGCFVGDAIVAASGFELWGERIAHIAVVTHPAHRGLGYGARVVSAIAAVVLERGLIPQYRTLMSNTPSIKIGAALGFVPYAESLALRLAQDEAINR